MDTIAAVEVSYDRLGRLLAGLEPGQLDAPSTLAGWDVRHLANHTLAFVGMMTAAAEGAPMPDEDPAAGQADLLGGDPAGVVAMVVRDSLAAWRQPGILDAEVATPLGSLPGAAALSLVIMETTVHGTDLARSTGQDESVDPAVAELAYWVVA